MDDHGDDPLNDTAFDREIEAALAVDPSPEFLARVRARVATGRAHGGWVLSQPRAWATAGAAALAAVAVVGLWLVSSPVGAPQDSRLVVEAPAPDPPVRLPEARAANATPAAVPTVPARDLRPEPRVTQPEVLISKDEAAALQQLFDAINQGRVEPSVLPDLDSVVMPLAPIEEIVLEPIRLSPLARLDSVEGERP